MSTLKRPIGHLDLEHHHGPVSRWTIDTSTVRSWNWVWVTSMVTCPLKPWRLVGYPQAVDSLVGVELQHLCGPSLSSGPSKAVAPLHVIFWECCPRRSLHVLLMELSVYSLTHSLTYA